MIQRQQPIFSIKTLRPILLIGLLLGATVGATLNLLYAPAALGEEKSAAYLEVVWWAEQVVKPFGDLFQIGHCFVLLGSNSSL